MKKNRKRSGSSTARLIRRRWSFSWRAKRGWRRCPGRTVTKSPLEAKNQWFPLIKTPLQSHQRATTVISLKT